MFGEDFMLGVNSQKIEAKGRFIIPKDTKVETDDKLVIVDKDSFLEIWLLETLKNKIIKYEGKRDMSKNINEFEYYQNLINFITTNVIKIDSVDSQGRISIGMDYLKKDNESENREMIVERVGNYIRIWPDKNFKKYKDDVNKKVLKNNKYY